MTIKELNERRLKLIADARAILNSADAANRSLTAEEQEQYDKLLAEEAEIRGRIERMLELEKRNNIVVEVASNTAGNSNQYRSAFDRYVRVGLSGLDPAEYRALGVGTGASGGYLVPREMDDLIVQLLIEQNFVRGIATVIRTNSPHDIPVESSLGTAAWTAEAAAFTESDVTFAQKTLSGHKLATLVKVSEELLQDSAFDLEAYLASVIARRFAVAEEAAFLVGDGSGKPSGIFPAAGVGVTAAANNAIAADELISLYYSLASPYRARAVWVMKDSTAAAIRKLKDSQGQYLWQPALSAGSPDTLLGRPVYTSTNVDAIGSSKRSVLFADFSFYYIGERGPRQLQRLNEAFAVNGQVGFRAWERLDGVLTLQDAAKVLVHPA